MLSDIGGDKSCLTLNTFFAEKFFIVFIAQETLKLPFPARFHGQQADAFLCVDLTRSPLISPNVCRKICIDRVIVIVSFIVNNNNSFLTCHFKM